LFRACLKRAAFLTDFSLQKKSVYDAGSVPNILGPLFNRKGLLKKATTSIAGRSLILAYSNDFANKKSRIKGEF
jgi:hypothetical protein